jgi:hypothetical protein
MPVRRSVLTIFVCVVLGGCSGGGAGPAPKSSPVGSTTAVGLRSERLTVYAMTYLASNRASPVLQVFTAGPVAVVGGTPVDVLVQLHPAESAVWVGMRPQRSEVHAQHGSGRIVVATDGCRLTGTASCDPRLLYAPTAFPIGGAPSGGVVTDHGFALHVVTSAMHPGSYELTFPIRYPSNLNQAAVLDVTDTLHVRLDVDSGAPPSSRCTVADLHRPRVRMPVAHVLAHTVVLAQGEDRLDPPPPGTKPRIPASVAWRQLAPGDSGSGGTRSLVLALLTATTPATQLPNGTLVEDIHDTLAWVLYTYGQAVDSREFHGPGLTGPVGLTGPAGVGNPAPAPSAPCVFTYGVGAMNAMTGHGLFNGGGFPERDPVRI